MTVSANSVVDAVTWMFGKLESEPGYFQSSLTWPQSIVVALPRSSGPYNPKEARIFSVFAPLEENRIRFQQLACENPKLLPLLLVALCEGKLDSTLETGAALKAWFRANGVTRAGWCYLCHHGAQIFRIPWAVSANGPTLNAAAAYLRMLQVAGLPPPPPDSLVLAWLQSYAPDMAGLLDFDTWSLREPAAVLRIAFAEANRRQTDPEFQRFIEDFLGVSVWAKSTKPLLDRNRRRQGWKWIERKWLAWEYAQRQRDMASNIRWESLLPAFEQDGYCIRPLVSPLEMFDEGVAMRNCIGRLVVECADDETRIFSVTRQDDGERIANIRIYFFNGKWYLHDVRGFANRPAPPAVRALGQEVAERYARLHTQRVAVAAAEDAASQRAKAERDLEIALYEFGTLVVDGRLPLKSVTSGTPVKKPSLNPDFDL